MMPVTDPMDAMPVEPEVQFPVPGELFNVMVEPTHTVPGPVIAAGNGLTVTVILDEQPLG
jgi:hypothetical protein